MSEPTSGSRDASIPIWNMFHLLESAARSHAGKVAVVIGPHDDEITYGELLTRAVSFAAELAATGVSAGDRVALWLENSVDWVVAAMAIARVGGVLVPVNTRWTLRELIDLSDIVTPKVLVASSGLLMAAPAGMATKDQAGDAVSRLSLRDLQTFVIGDDSDQRGKRLPFAAPPVRVGARRLGVSGVPTNGLPAMPAPGDGVTRSAECDASVGAILATSGTTSKPKAVMLTHASLTRLAAAIAHRQELDDGDRLCTVAPFYHCSGLVHGILTAFAARCSLHATSRYRADETERTLRTKGITSYHGFALPLQEAAAQPAFDPHLLHAFRGAWFSAPAAAMSALESRYGVKMCELYGMTETSGNSLMTSPHDSATVRHGTDGHPHDGIEVAVFDPDGAVRLEHGREGEIRVRGWNLMRGYFGDPVATARAIDEEGWLHTGDTGVSNVDGTVTFLARLGDMIRVGGENVNPAEVEAVLGAHEKVRESGAIGVPHPRLDQVVVAFVVLDHGVDCDSDELTAYCADNLAQFKVPRRFIFVDALPKTGATARLQRSILKARFVELHDSAESDRPDLAQGVAGAMAPTSNRGET